MSGTSILNFDAGISRVVWEQPGQVGTLPDRRQLPPSDLAANLQLNRLLLADNVETALIHAMLPAVVSPNILSPAPFRAALATARRAVDRALGEREGLSDTDAEALERLGREMDDQQELAGELDYFRDMLIAG